MQADTTSLVDFIRSWLATVEPPGFEAAEDQGLLHKNKRKRDDTIMTPPSTHPSADREPPRTPSTKRLRSDEQEEEVLGQNDDQIDDTPRAPVPALQSKAGSGITSLTSSASSRQSPIKKLRTMGLSDGGFSVKEFDEEYSKLPAGLRSLVLEMTQIGQGKAVVPFALKATAPAEGPGQQVPADAFRPDPVNGETILAWPDGLRLLKQARLCAKEGMTEGAWNMEVHHALLTAVFRPGHRPGLVDFRIAYGLLPILAAASFFTFC